MELKIKELIKDLREQETDALGYLRSFAKEENIDEKYVINGKFIDDIFTNRAYDVATFDVCKRIIEILEEILESN
jgi:hypothetical protein